MLAKLKQYCYRWELRDLHAVVALYCEHYNAIARKLLYTSPSDKAYAAYLQKRLDDVADKLFAARAQIRAVQTDYAQGFTPVYFVVLCIGVPALALAIALVACA